MAMGSLLGKRALVTAGGQGIGKAIAEGLLKAGCELAVHYHSDENGAREVVALAESLGRKARPFQADLTVEAAAAETVDEAAAFLGGLSLVNILASTFFGAISGSSIADTASIGSVLIPEMEKKGYPRDFATAVTCCGSVQALLIPPSHNAVIYSLAAGGTVSVGALFLGGVAPGLLLGATLAVMCLCFAHKRKYPKGESIPLKQALKIALDAFWGLMTMVIILGGILSGVFIATESASIAVVWAFFVTLFIYRDYKWKDLPKLIGFRRTLLRRHRRPGHRTRQPRSP
jgi:NAD(P)-dependent dehydrogenase (short-subunit alcohol dehydrogenase family)